MRPPANGVKPHVMLIVGVNGTGKTTTVGKLANQIKSEGKVPLICAADTFRAAAVDQLQMWADRAGVDIVRAREGSDPAAVVFDALAASKSRGRDTVLVDTAGRLHTRTNLMNELDKIRRVAEREVPGAPHEVLLVLDATVGQNGLAQAREFTSVAGVNGIVLTKLDGTAKGGIAVAIAHDLKVPIRYVGVGEGIDDLLPFSPQRLRGSAVPGKVVAANRSTSATCGARCFTLRAGKAEPRPIRWSAPSSSRRRRRRRARLARAGGRGARRSSRARSARANAHEAARCTSRSSRAATPGGPARARTRVIERRHRTGRRRRCRIPIRASAGKGFAMLRAHGIAVEEGLCEDDAARLNAGVHHGQHAGRPLVVLKAATSLDGRVAAAPGQRTPLSSREANRKTQTAARERGRHCRRVRNAAGGRSDCSPRATATGYGRSPASSSTAGCARRRRRACSRRWPTGRSSS